jgi:hypothetical protein
MLKHLIKRHKFDLVAEGSLRWCCEEKFSQNRNMTIWAVLHVHCTDEPVLFSDHLVPNVASEWLAFLIRIGEDTGSYLGQVTRCAYLGLPRRTSGRALNCNALFANYSAMRRNTVESFNASLNKLGMARLSIY